MGLKSLVCLFVVTVLIDTLAAVVPNKIKSGKNNANISLLKIKTHKNRSRVMLSFLMLE